MNIIEADYQEIQRFSKQLKELTSKINNDAKKMQKSLELQEKVFKDRHGDDLQETFDVVIQRLEQFGKRNLEYANHLDILAKKVQEYCNCL